MAAAEVVYQVVTLGNKLIGMVKDAEECEERTTNIASRMQSILLAVDNASLSLNDENTSACHSLRELRSLIITITNLVDSSIRSEARSTVKRNASNIKRALFSGSRLKEATDAEKKLDTIVSDLTFAMVTVARHQPSEARHQPSDDVQLAIQLAKIAGSSKLLKVVKRRLEGNVIFDELVEEDDILGTGSFGIVKAGKYYRKPVAIKKALSNVFGSQQSIMSQMITFREEANTHFLLQHDRVVKVFAFSAGEGTRPPCLIMERMEGTLYDILERGNMPPLSNRLEYLIDICEGLKYLAQNRVVHSDIKSKNILLCEGQAKVSDFGLAQVCSTIGTMTGNAAATTNMAGTRFWMAPEVLASEKGRFDSDIFSLHVVMWEIIENRKGGVGLSVGERLLTDEAAKLPLSALMEEKGCDNSCRKRLIELVRKCGLKERKDRPKIDEVLDEVTTLYDAVARDPAGLTDSGEVGVLFASSPPSEGDGATSLSEIRRRNQEHDEESKQGPPSWRDDGRSLIAAEGDGQIVRLTRANEAMERVSSSLAKVEWRALEAHLTNKGDKRRSTVITIHNATGSRMVLCRSHDIHGSPVDPFPTIIDSGSWEVVLHTKAPWSLYGSEGYVVYKAENADGETYEVSLGFMTSYQTIRSVYVEANEESHSNNPQHVELMTARINENRQKSYSWTKHGLAVVGIIAHNSPRPCQFVVGLDGSKMASPWA